MKATQTPVERPTVDLVGCVCGEIEEIEVEHQGGMKRMSCPCGICSPYELHFDNCYISWNEMQEKLEAK